MQYHETHIMSSKYKHFMCKFFHFMDAVVMSSNHLSKIFLGAVFVVLSLQVSGNCFQICCDSLLKAWLFFECNTGVVMMTSESKIWAMYP